MLFATICDKAWRHGRGSLTSTVMTNYKLAKLNDAGGNLQARWFVYYSYLHPETAKKERFRIYISSTLKTATARREKAEELKRAINDKLKRGWSPYQFESMKFSTVANALLFVLEIKKTTCRSRTHHTYKHLITFFIGYLEKKGLKNITLDCFNSHHAQAFLDYAKSEKGIANRTYNYYAMHMRIFFNFLIERDYTTFNPFQKIKKLTVEESEITCFTPKELHLIRTDLREKDFDLYIISCFIFYCAIRPAELMRLRVMDIKLDKDLIIIPANANKNKKYQTVTIPEPFKRELLKFGLNYPGEYYLFTRHLQRGKKQAAPTRIAGYWREWADQVGISKNIYSLKHTAAGMLIESGCDIRDLQLHFRHSSLEMTQIYAEKFKNRPGERLKNSFPEM